MYRNRINFLLSSRGTRDLKVGFNAKFMYFEKVFQSCVFIPTSSNQIKLNKTLDSTNKQIFKDEKNVDQENNNQNHNDLIKVIGLLNSELDELKKEIISLKEK